MATLALAAAGAAIGSTVLPTGLTVLGATISGAAIGSQLGALAGSYVDQALFGSSGETRTLEGPRLSDLHVTASTEGAPIPRLYGRVRLGGQIIWADEIEEVILTSTSSGSGGGKGIGSGGSPGQTQSIEYRYYASFAVAIAEGPITGIGRVWADGRQLNLSKVTWRLHRGGEAQARDSLIAAKLGASDTPAYRGVAYIVFERLALARYGNRLPQLSFEVYRSIESFGKDVRAVVLIPGSGEFVYAPTPVVEETGLGATRALNVNTRQGESDWAVAIDQLEEGLPNAKNVSLVVSWFGTDLRAGHCRLVPGVDAAQKATRPASWRVAGVDRADAYLVSQQDGRAAYGGTPSDDTVIAAIQDLKARGLSVTMNPFILMDVPHGNGLPDPHGSGNAQPAYPWRGRITIDPAPGHPGSVDKTAAAAAQIASFVGTATPGDFSIAGGAVVYTGPAEWSLRRMVLHHAFLAKAAGGVDAFLLGSELRGLTWVRSAAGAYPFVAALVALAADVKAVLGATTKVSYGADWTEYFGHHPADGSGDVYFHLDPLWASPHVDAIGIDCYWPLTDWRDGRDHADYLAGARSTYELGYLRANVCGGEGYDWYYANAADRDAQLRTPITDGQGKPWVFRYKDVKSWWQSPHFDRPGGVEAATATAWVPQSKPIWFTEVGCPTVDKGANQPNVFVDPKSSENALPYYSRGSRDDLVQRRYLRAFIEAFDPASPGYVTGLNPISTIYGGRMVDVERIHLYAWDARPYPAFPDNVEVWGDGPNWRLGHWLTGRLAGGSLAETMARILVDYGFTDHETGNLAGTVPGFVIDRIMSARDAIQPLSLAYFFDAIESGGRIAFRHRGSEPPVADLTEDTVVEDGPGAPLALLTRGQETELPASAKITYITTRGGFRQAVAEARRVTGASGRIAKAELPIVLDTSSAAQIAEAWLFEAWASRERASFKLPPSRIDLEPGDAVRIAVAGKERLYRITEIADRGHREVEARSLDPDVYGGPPVAERDSPGEDGVLVGQPLVEFLDLPLLRGDEPGEAGYVAALQSPWPGGVAVYGSPEPTGYALKALAAAPAIMGTTLDDLSPGPEGRMDRAHRIRVQVAGGPLASVGRQQMLGGSNAAAIRGAQGLWEVIQFERAELIGDGIYELSGLLRGQAGSEAAMAEMVPAGARFVLLDAGLTRVQLSLDEVGLAYNWRFGPISRDLGDASYANRTHAFGGTGLKPLSPVHVCGRRNGADLEISWIRRTRSGGDSWEASEVPLAEDAERYELDVLDGASVVRTIVSNAPSAHYSAAEQVADFGSPQSSVAVRVHQVSATMGRGWGRTADV